MMWISSAETRLNTHFEIAPDLDTVKKQKRELEVHFSHSFLTGFFFRGYAVKTFQKPKILKINKSRAGKHSTGIKMTYKSPE